MSTARAVAFLQIVPDRRDGAGNVITLKVAAVTMRKPERPAPRAIVAKVTLEIPSSLFAPIVVPEISIRIPETLGASGEAVLEAVVAQPEDPAS